jgi:hypothetical protein
MVMKHMAPSQPTGQMTQLKKGVYVRSAIVEGPIVQIRHESYIYPIVISAINGGKPELFYSRAQELTVVETPICECCGQARPGRMI